VSDSLVVEVRRGPHVESRHLVDAVVVDADGSVAESWGDASRMVLPRSALKPVQSSPIVASGAADAAGLTRGQLALACASHGGEPFHVSEVTDWLARLGLDADALECGAQAPTHPASATALVRAGEAFDGRHNTCSGKHCGFLAVCSHLGLSTQGYAAPDHPLQRDHVTPAVEQWCGVSLAAQIPGVDGCGIPAFAVPLDRLARGWAALAADPTGRRMFDAMVSEPEMVAGTGRVCTRLIQDGAGRVVAKTGAEGVYCAIDRSTGVAVALKAHDGATRASEVAIEWVLVRLAALPPAEPRLLHNRAGTVVGAVRVAD
jgi:L-asparaginase II